MSLVCPRCGNPVVGIRGAKLCQPCASSLSAKRKKNWRLFKTGSVWRSPRHIPVTLPGKDKP